MIKYQMKKADRAHLWNRLCINEAIFECKAFAPTMVVVATMLFLVFAFQDPGYERMAEGAMITFWLIVGCGVLLSVVAALIPILPGTKEPFLLFVDESTGEIVYQYREKTKRFRFKGVTYDRKGEYMMIRGVKSRPIVLPDNAEFRAFAASLIQPNGK